MVPSVHFRGGCRYWETLSEGIRLSDSGGLGDLLSFLFRATIRPTIQGLSSEII